MTVRLTLETIYTPSGTTTLLHVTEPGVGKHTFELTPNQVAMIRANGFLKRTAEARDLLARLTLKDFTKNHFKELKENRHAGHAPEDC